MRTGFSRRETIGMFGAAMLASSTALQAQPGGDAAAWLRRNAHPLEADPAQATLQPLVRALDGGQMIGLGEATHGSHEDQALKAAIVRALISYGDVRLLALEVNRGPGGRLDDYVRGGAPDPVSTLRDPNFPQAWQSEEFLGLITWIRAWNAAGRPQIRIAGIDRQSMGADALQAFEFLQNNAPRYATPFEEPLAPLIANPRLRDGSAYDLVRSLSRSQWEAARQALEQMRVLIQGSTRPGAPEAAAAALAARQALDASRAYTSFATEAERNSSAAGSLRDRLLADNLITIGGTTRTVYWAHNLHVLGGAGRDSTGAYLRRRLARRYRTLVFDYERGTINAKNGSGPALDRVPWQTVERPPVAGSLGALLASAGPDRFWVDLKPAADAPPASWVAQSYPHDWQEVGLVPAGVSGSLEDADLLVFLKQLTPSRLLPSGGR